mgnify:CR=1 FL=1
MDGETILTNMLAKLKRRGLALDSGDSYSEEELRKVVTAILRSRRANPNDDDGMLATLLFDAIRTVADLGSTTAGKGASGVATAPISGIDGETVQAVLAELTARGSGQEWQDSVLSRHDASGALPVDPSDGDRYLCSVAGNDWDLGTIYQWDDDEEVWQDTEPTTGMMVAVDDEDGAEYRYNGSVWAKFDQSALHVDTLWDLAESDAYEDKRLAVVKNGDVTSFFVPMMGTGDGDTLYSLYTAHIALGNGAGHDGGADVTNTLDTELEDPAELLNDFKTNFNAHCANDTAHGSADAANVITQDNAVSGDPTSQFLLYNACVEALVAHVPDVSGDPAIHDAALAEPDIDELDASSALDGLPGGLYVFDDTADTLVPDGDAPYTFSLRPTAIDEEDTGRWLMVSNLNWLMLLVLAGEEEGGAPSGATDYPATHKADPAGDGDLAIYVQHVVDLPGQWPRGVGRLAHVSATDVHQQKAATVGEEILYLNVFDDDGAANGTAIFLDEVTGACYADLTDIAPAHDGRIIVAVGNSGTNGYAFLEVFHADDTSGYKQLFLDEDGADGACLTFTSGTAENSVLKFAYEYSETE